MGQTSECRKQGYMCAKLHYKVRTLHQQDIIDASKHHWVMDSTGRHHVYLSWVQKCNFMMSMHFEATFRIKRVGFCLNLTTIVHSDVP